jgi:hypothetical protein
VTTSQLEKNTLSIISEQRSRGAEEQRSRGADEQNITLNPVIPDI